MNVLAHVILQVLQFSGKKFNYCETYVQNHKIVLSVHMEKVPYNVGKRTYGLTLHVEGNGSMAETLLPEWACFRPGAWPPL
jgi:hypothetical protein